jgi:uridine phosphorylase
MIHETFDNKTDAIITPEAFYGSRDKLCDTCIITFSNAVMESVLKKFDCTQIAEIYSANGNFPIYKFTYKGKEIAFYMSMISSVGAGTCIEDARCLIGATKYIMFGSCGTLNNEITSGKLIVPTEAYRDEGFSYHYIPAKDYIKMKNSDIVAKEFDKLGLPYVMGKTWTTDAIYRETRGNMEKRKQEGCIAVEMECAGLQAVCDFRGLELYSFLISGDLLDAPEWDRRILGDEEEKNHQLNNFYIALELAIIL